MAGLGLGGLGAAAGRRVEGAGWKDARWIRQCGGGGMNQWSTGRPAGRGPEPENLGPGGGGCAGHRASCGEALRRLWLCRERSN